jgi:hypothetical protein
MVTIVALMDSGRHEVGLIGDDLYVRDTRVGSREYKRGWFRPVIQNLDNYLTRCAANFGWDVVRLDGGESIPASDPFAHFTKED